MSANHHPFPSLHSPDRSGDARKDHDWSIWAFCYAVGKMPHDFLSGTPVASNRGTVEVPMICGLLQSTDGELVMIDTGFAAGVSMTGRAFDEFVRSDEILRRFGFDPRDVRKIVLTHMHFDHAGNLDAFPDARIYLQRLEYEGWKSAIAEFGGTQQEKNNWVFSSLSLADFESLERAMAEGRVEFLEGDTEVVPGVMCHLAKNTHTFGSQWLEVATARGNFALAGDCCYTFENVERMWPPGFTQGDTWNMLRSFQQMKAVAGDDLSRLLPGHDIQMFARHPSAILQGTRFAELHLAEGHTSLLAKAKVTSAPAAA